MCSSNKMKSNILWLYKVVSLLKTEGAVTVFRLFLITAAMEVVF